ncbi:uncharacterized protein JCM15063_006022 [Sporobolomyces koalae]|uniref:uncharacterized protein n=1 Tax=Sporobolomyces koalae TaxID=500713 RepID=UPI0031709227
MVLSLKSKRDEMSIALLEDTLFLSPSVPPHDAFRSDSPTSSPPRSTGQQGPESDSLERESLQMPSVEASHDHHAEPTNDPILRGQVTLKIHSARRAKKIRVQLIGRSAAHGGDGSTSYEATTTLEKNLEIDLKGERLEKGTHTWDFSFIIPASTPVSERSYYGSIRHSVRATLYGAANVRDLSSAVQPIWLIANPSPEGELPSGLEIDVRHSGLLRSLDSAGASEDDVQLGPISLHVSSPHLTVASLLFLSVTFENPPHGLKIMSVSAFILQSFDVTFTDKTITPVKPASQKKLLFWVDSTSPIAESTEDLLERPNLSRGSLPPLAFERRALLAQPLARLEGGQDWTYARVSRVPDDDAVRPSTLPGTITPIRVKHKLVVQVKYRLKGSKKDLVLEMSSPVMIASCCCLTSSLLLPRYRSHLSTAHHPSSHHVHESSLTRSDTSSGFLPTDGPLTPFHRRCLCNTPLQALVDQEGEALAGAAELRSRSRSNSHSRSSSDPSSRGRRTGGIGATGAAGGGGGSSSGFTFHGSGGVEEDGQVDRGRARERKAGEAYAVPFSSLPAYAPFETESGGGGQSWETQGANLNATPRPPTNRTTRAD